MKTIRYASIAGLLLILTGCGSKSTPFMGTWEGKMGGRDVTLTFAEKEVKMTRGDRTKKAEPIYFASVGQEDPAYAIAIKDEDDVLVVRMDGNDTLKLYEGGESKLMGTLSRTQ